ESSSRAFGDILSPFAGEAADTISRLADVPLQLRVRVPPPVRNILIVPDRRAPIAQAFGETAALQCRENKRGLRSLHTTPPPAVEQLSRSAQLCPRREQAGQHHLLIEARDHRAEGIRNRAQ